MPITAAYALAGRDQFLIQKVEAPYSTFYRLDARTGTNLNFAFKTMSSAAIKYATVGSSPVDFGSVVTDTEIAFFQLDQSEMGFNSETVVKTAVRAQNFTFD